MQLSIDEDYWQSLRAHAATNVTDPPWAVILAVAALLGDSDEIKVSWVTYKPANPDGHTTWSVFIVTAGRLIHVELQFDAESYDLHEDNQQFRRVTTRVIASWVRRLADIAHIEIGACDTRLPEGGSRNWLGIGGVGLVFTDGCRVDLPLNQRAMDRGADRKRSDDFLAAIRSGSQL